VKQLRRSNERGQADHGWLKSLHSFSFANYYDPNFMGFRDLRVINQDVIAGGGGFPTHGHSDMEILTYVLSGALRHKDSEGNSEVIRPGEIQKMSAGTGIHHSEFNESSTEPCELLQIWLSPDKRGVKPSYDQKKIDWSTPGLKLIASPDSVGSDHAVHLEQDAKVFACQQKDVSHYQALPGRYYWIQVIEGQIEVLGEVLSAGDAMAYYEDSGREMAFKGSCHFLLFDLN